MHEGTKLSCQLACSGLKRLASGHFSRRNSRRTTRPLLHGLICYIYNNSTRTSVLCSTMNSTVCRTKSGKIPELKCTIDSIRPGWVQVGHLTRGPHGHLTRGHAPILVHLVFALTSQMPIYAHLSISGMPMSMPR